MKKGKITAVAIALAITVSTTLAPSSAFAKKVNTGGTIKWAVTSGPINLCPFLASDTASSEVYYHLFRGLLKRDWNNKLVPDCASAMPKVSKDLKTYTFNLRKDVKWHDGKPFTSADVKFSFEMMLDPKTASLRAGDYEEIKSIDAPNPYTVVFHLSRVNSFMLDNFENPYIIPKHLWEKCDRTKAKQFELNKKPIGNGPFKFADWKEGERLTLQANPNFYEGKPAADKIVYDIVPSTAVQMVKLETGEDNVAVVPSSELTRMESKPSLKMYKYDRAAFECINYNHKSPIFSDKRVRQAFAYATNKKVICSGIFKGNAKPTEGPFHPSNEVFDPTVKVHNYDLAKARNLLDQAGWKVGKDGIRAKNGKKLQFDLWVNKASVARVKMAVVLQSQYKLIGAKVEPRLLDWATILTKYIEPGKFEVYLGGFSGSGVDQTGLFYSDKKKAGLNRGYYANKEMDKLLDGAKLTGDKAQIKKMYKRVQEIISDEQPMTFLLYTKATMGTSKKVKGVKYENIVENNSGKGVTTWSVTP